MLLKHPGLHININKKFNAMFKPIINQNVLGIIVVGIATVHKIHEYMLLIGQQKNLCRVLHVIYTIFNLCRSLSWKESKALLSMPKVFLLMYPILSTWETEAPAMKMKYQSIILLASYACSCFLPRVEVHSREGIARESIATNKVAPAPVPDRKF